MIQNKVGVSAIKKLKAYNNRPLRKLKLAIFSGIRCKVNRHFEAREI